MRLASRKDTVQSSIVKGLRKCGFRVEVLGRPVDLMVCKTVYLLPHATCWRLLEVKTPTQTGKRRKRKDQQEQDRFITETGTPIVTSLEEALEALKGL